MNLETVNSLAQILAVVLVVPSLIYLALQVRQNTRQLRAAARYQFVEATGQVNMTIAGDKHNASVFRRGLDCYDELDADEEMQFAVFVGHFYQIYSMMWELYEDKLLPASQWHSVRKDLVFCLRAEGGRRVWDSIAENAFAPEFYALGEAIKNSDETSFILTQNRQRVAS